MSSGKFVLIADFGKIFTRRWSKGGFMRLDPDLIKKILTALEETDKDDPNEYLSSLNKIEGYSYEGLIYHIRQLIEGGYIDGEVIDSLGRIGSGLFIRRLTWKGHDFVENSRNDTIWNKAKTTILSRVGGIPLDVLSETLKNLVNNALSGG